MKDPGFQPAEPRPIEAPRERRARHFPRSGRLFVVALLMLVAFAGGLAFVLGVSGLLMTQNRDWGWLALGGLGVVVIARGIVFIISDALHCPLCHGAVMRERRCHKHADAFRLWPLSHRASAVLSLLTTFGFRCMYCGTAFRLGRRSRN
jgi:hypothetical protein